MEFRQAQMEARYQQMIQQAEVDCLREKDAAIAEKAEEYTVKLAAETKRLQEEQIKKHAQMTQEIFEDVTRTLKDEQKRKLAQTKKDLEAQYEEKLRVVDNNYNGLLAKERQAKGKTELKNAQLEAEILELRAEVKRALDEDKENHSRPGSSRQITDKELSKKLKKLNRTLSSSTPK